MVSLVVAVALLLGGCRLRGTPTPTLPLPTPTPTATPTAPAFPATPTLLAPSPTPTATPLPATTPTTPSQASPFSLGEQAYGYVATLSQRFGPRPSATPREREAAQYIASQLEGFGYSVQLQEFTVADYSDAQPRLVVQETSPRPVQAVPMEGSPSGRVTGPLVFVGLARPGDIPPSGLQGAVALIERGVIPFRDKVANVASAGATAAVVYNNELGIVRAVVGQATIPAVTISREDGQDLRDSLAQGPVFVEVNVQAVESPSANVVAERSDGQGPVLVLGGHYDTVPVSPGANDNASGIAVMLEVASRLATQELPFALRVIAFGSEETGLNGSRHYVASLSQQERDRIIGMLNFDALGAGQLLLIGDVEMTAPALALAEGLGIPARVASLPANTSSDHASFQAVGIPTLFFTGSDESRFHTPQDTLEHVDRELLGRIVGLAQAFIQRMPPVRPQPGAP